MTGGRHVPNSWADEAAILGAEPTGTQLRPLSLHTEEHQGQGAGFSPQGTTDRVYFMMKSWVIGHNTHPPQTVQPEAGPAQLTGGSVYKRTTFALPAAPTPLDN